MGGKMKGVPLIDLKSSRFFEAMAKLEESFSHLANGQPLEELKKPKHTGNILLSWICLR